jgi:hypothetical protein
VATVTGLSAGTPYYIFGSAYNASGSSSINYFGSVPTIPAAPGAPTLTVPGAQQITASWTAVTGATSYSIFYGTTTSPTTAGPTGIAGTSVTISGLLAGRTYYMRLKATNASGTSDYGTVSAGKITIPAAPSAPTLNGGTNQVAAYWSIVTGASSYSLYYGTTTSPTTLWASGITSTSATVTGLLAGRTYYMRLTATNASGTSDYGMVSAGEITIPAAPAAPTVNAGGSRTLTIAWTAVTGAVNYQVWYRLMSSDPSGATQAGTTTANLYSLGGLSPSVVYYIWIKAGNDSGVSGFSDYDTGVPNP